MLRPGQVRVIRVAVIEEHEVFRKGLVACLREDTFIEVVADEAAGPVTEKLDVAVVSPRVANSEHFDCPIIVCGEGGITPAIRNNRVLGTLPRSTLTIEQLSATVRAAAAGLRVDAGHAEVTPPGGLDQRSLDVLRLLAEGADTHEIAVSIRYSERTVKGFIQLIERELGARSRAQAVAEGIRRRLIPVPSSTTGQRSLPGRTTRSASG